MGNLRRWMTLPAALSVACLGCGGSIRSKPIGPDVKAADTYGVVYELTKPEFKVVRTPATATAPTKYTLAVEYVPDPSHRYGLIIKPGSLSKVDTSVTLSAKGAITGLTADNQEQVTPTIKAIGDFTVSLLQAVTSGVSAGLVPFSAEADQETSFAEQVDELKARVQRLPGPATQPDKDRIKAAIDDANIAKPDAGRFSRLLANRLPQAKDREYLAAAVAAPNPNGTAVADARAEYQKAMGKPLAASGLPEDEMKALAEEWKRVSWDINRAVAINDHLQLTRLSALEKAGGDVLLAAGVNPSSAESLASDVDARAAKARIYVLKRMSLATLAGPLAIPPTPARLKQERVNELLLTIAGAELRLGSASDAAARTQIIEALAADWQKVFDLLDARVEYEAIQKIEVLLKRGPGDLTNAGKRSLVEEYARARAEWVALIGQYTVKLERLKVDAADPPPPKKDVWGEENTEVALLWNVQEEATMSIAAAASGADRARAIEAAAQPRKAPARLLAFRGAPQFQHDPIAERVRGVRGDDVSNWPKFVVRVDKAQKERP